ncbi:hypothetical protein IJT10_04320 [bacterium]|nr:hypothetical protein [bacterium]
MANLNRYGFPVFVAAATSLLLGLYAVGCGSDTELTKPDPSKANTGKVTFSYRDEGTPLYAKTILPSDVSKVVYTFTRDYTYLLGSEYKFGGGSSESTESIEKSNETIDKSSTSSSTTKDERDDSTAFTSTDVTVSGVPVDANKVSAFYYDSANNIIAIGVNQLSWSSEGNTSVATISNPDFNESITDSLEDELFTVVAPNHVDVGESLLITPYANYTDVQGRKSALILSDIATFTTKSGKYVQEDKFALDRTPSNKVTPGYYTGKVYGQHEIDIDIEDLGLVGLTSTTVPIYVTDAQLSSIYINADDNDQITLLAADDSLGLSEVFVQNLSGVVDVKKARVTATGRYVSDNGNPGFETDVTSMLSWSSDNKKDFKDGMEGGVFVLKALNSSKETTAQITATVTNKDDVVVSDTVTLRAIPAKAKLKTSLNNTTGIVSQELTRGTVEGYFTITDGESEYDSSSTSVVYSENCTVKARTSNMDDEYGRPYVYKDGEDFILDTTHNLSGDVVAISANYNGDDANIKAETISVTVDGSIDESDESVESDESIEIESEEVDSSEEEQV